MSHVKVDRPFRTSFMWHLGGMAARAIGEVIALMWKAAQR